MQFLLAFFAYEFVIFFHFNEKYKKIKHFCLALKTIY